MVGAVRIKNYENLSSRKEEEKTGVVCIYIQTRLDRGTLKEPSQNKFIPLFSGKLLLIQYNVPMYQHTSLSLVFPTSLFVFLRLVFQTNCLSSETAESHLNP
jgi:hypothetical protein